MSRPPPHALSDFKCRLRPRGAPQLFNSGHAIKLNSLAQNDRKFCPSEDYASQPPFKPYNWQIYDPSAHCS